MPGIKISDQFIPTTGYAPTGETYGLLDAWHLIDGLRNVETLNDMYNIYLPRRRKGMIVGVAADNSYWRLKEDVGSIGTASDWELLNIGSNTAQTFLSLTDVDITTYNEHRIPFEHSSGMTDSADLTWNDATKVLDVDGIVNIDSGLTLNNDHYVNEITTVINIDSTDLQLPTAKAVWTSDLWVLNSAITYIQTGDISGSGETNQVTIWHDDDEIIGTNRFTFGPNLRIEDASFIINRSDQNPYIGLEGTTNNYEVYLGLDDQGILSPTGTFFISRTSFPSNLMLSITQSGIVKAYSGITLNTGVFTNEITTIVNDKSTHEQLPTAKAVYDVVEEYAIASGGTSTALNDGTAQGQMAFWSAATSIWTYTETNELFWDDQNKYLGIGDNSPNYNLSVAGMIAIDDIAFVDLDGSDLLLGDVDGNAVNVKIQNSTGSYIYLKDSTNIITISGETVELGGHIKLSESTQTVNEIVTVVNASSTDEQLPTAAAVWNSDLWVLNSAITYIETSDTDVDNGTTQGQMLFWSAATNRWTYTETSELFWDDQYKRLGINNNSPTYPIDVTGIYGVNGIGFVLESSDILRLGDVDGASLECVIIQTDSQNQYIELNGTEDQIDVVATDINITGQTVTIGQNLKLVKSSQLVDEITTVVNELSTDEQLPTAAAVWTSDLWVLNSAITYVASTVSGVTTFLELTDTINEYNEHRVLVESDDSVIDYSGLTFDADDLNVQDARIQANNIIARGTNQSHPTGIGTYVELYIYGSDTGRIFAYNGSSYKDLAIGDWNSGDPNIMLKVGGNVGIGEGSPSTKLDVAGIITAQSGITLSTGVFANEITTVVNVLSTDEQLPTAAAVWDADMWLFDSAITYIGSTVSGVTTFLELTDTIDTFTSQRVLFENDSNVIDYSGFTYNPNILFTVEGGVEEGFQTTASGLFAHAEGSSSIASGPASHAEGRQTTASGLYSHAEGYYTIATGSYSHAEGRQTYANNYSHAEGYYTTATGSYSHAEGYGTQSLGQASHAEGRQTTASGLYSHAEGYYTIATGSYSHAEGRQTYANNYSHAEGYYTTATGSYSHAEGYGTQSLGQASHAEGYFTTSEGIASHAEGFSTKTYGLGSHSEGYLRNVVSGPSYGAGMGSYTKQELSAYGIGAHAQGSSVWIGRDSTTQIIADGDGSHAGGVAYVPGNDKSVIARIFAYGPGSFAGGYSVVSTPFPINDESNIVAWEKGSFAYGYLDVIDDENVIYLAASGIGSVALGAAYNSNIIAEGDGSLAGGYNISTTPILAQGDGSFAWGYNGVQALGIGSFAIGSLTTASGEYSYAEGRQTVASGDYSHAEGTQTTASASVSHAEGNRTTASGDNSHSEGYYSYSSGDNSHAEGYFTTSEGIASHSEGYGTYAEGDYSHAQGSGTTATGDYSHVEGYQTTAIGNASHAEGDRTVAINIFAHAEGYQTTAVYGHAEGRLTKSLSYDSHSEGFQTIASGVTSHASGWGTIAKGVSQTTIGAFNIENGDASLSTTPSTVNRDDHIFIIGNGTSDVSRSNAFTIDWRGRVEIASGITLSNSHFVNEIVTEINALSTDEEIPTAEAVYELVTEYVSVSGGTGGSGNIDDGTEQGQMAFWSAATDAWTHTETAELFWDDDNKRLGVKTNTPSYTLEVNGSFGATTKSFTIDHPTKPNMTLEHGSLEGPEFGVYHRGRLHDGTTVIELPDYWEGLVDLDTISVNLTPIGKHQKLYVMRVSFPFIKIGSGVMNGDIDCYYTVFAERKDIEKLIVEK